MKHPADAGPLDRVRPRAFDDLYVVVESILDSDTVLQALES